MDNEIPNATWKDRVLYFAGRRQAYLIEGDSMLPTLNDGDAVLIKPTRDIVVGDVILAYHPFKSSVTILKRVAEVAADGSLTLSGDNLAESTDSRSFGAVSVESIIGRVICRLK
ncbi:MAG: nickel-type superoxide dismutase maturation protease [Pyrinomonadaceae bacterium]